MPQLPDQEEKDGVAVVAFDVVNAVVGKDVKGIDWVKITDEATTIRSFTKCCNTQIVMNHPPGYTYRGFNRNCIYDPNGDLLKGDFPNMNVENAYKPDKVTGDTMDCCGMTGFVCCTVVPSGCYGHFCVVMDPAEGIFYPDPQKVKNICEV
jgi:hypothetical protein